MTAKTIEQLVAAFNLRDLQNAVTLHDWLAANRKTLADVRAYLARALRAAAAGPLYAMVNGKVKKIRKRTAAERAAWKAHLAELEAGPVRP